MGQIITDHQLTLSKTPAQIATRPQPRLLPATPHIRTSFQHHQQRPGALSPATAAAVRTLAGKRRSTSAAAPPQAAAAVMASTAAFTMPQEVFVAAARVTAAYAALFMGVLLWQGFNKLAMTAAAAKKKEHFDRYHDKRMLPFDRTVGNLIEWAVPFLCLFWLSMILTNGATLKWGWVYVGARAVYPFLAFKGIGAIGAKAPILLSTVPGYVALVNFLIPTVKTLFL